MAQELVATGSSLPASRMVKKFGDTIEHFMPAYDKLRDGAMKFQPTLAREGLEAMKSVDIGEFARHLEAWCVPASKQEIEAAVGEIIAVTKHLDKVDGPLFHAALVRFISDEQPSRIGLAVAARRVLLSARFTPSIAEVIEAVKSIEMDLRSAKQRIEWLPDHVKAAEAFLLRST